MIALRQHLRRRKAWPGILAMLLLFSIALVPSVGAQGNGGLGVGQGHGLEIGINLPVFEQIKADESVPA